MIARFARGFVMKCGGNFVSKAGDMGFDLGDQLLKLHCRDRV
jgi:hypothetical protein